MRRSFRKLGQRALFALVAVAAIEAAPVYAAPRQRPVVTEAAAIAIAIKACDESWGRYLRKHGGSKRISRDDWHAEKSDDRWRVWQGSNAQPAYEVAIPRDGSPVDGAMSCIAQMGWDLSEGPNRMVLGH